MWLGRDPAIIRDPACIAYLIYTAPASKQDPGPGVNLDPAYKRSYTVCLPQETRPTKPHERQDISLMPALSIQIIARHIVPTRHTLHQ